MRAPRSNPAPGHLGQGKKSERGAALQLHPLGWIAFKARGKPDGVSLGHKPIDTVNPPRVAVIRFAPKFYFVGGF